MSKARPMIEKKDERIVHPFFHSQCTQLYCIPHFNLVGMALTVFFLLLDSSYSTMINDKLFDTFSFVSLLK